VFQTRFKNRLDTKPIKEKLTKANHMLLVFCLAYAIAWAILIWFRFSKEPLCSNLFNFLNSTFIYILIILLTLFAVIFIIPLSLNWILEKLSNH